MLSGGTQRYSLDTRAKKVKKLYYEIYNFSSLLDISFPRVGIDPQPADSTVTRLRSCAMTGLNKQMCI